MNHGRGASDTVRRALQSCSCHLRRHLPRIVEDLADVLRYTRYWILYGLCALAVLSAIAGAIENALGY